MIHIRILQPIRCTGYRSSGKTFAEPTESFLNAFIAGQTRARKLREAERIHAKQTRRAVEVESAFGRVQGAKTLLSYWLLCLIIFRLQPHTHRHTHTSSIIVCAGRTATTVRVHFLCVLWWSCHAFRSASPGVSCCPQTPAFLRISFEFSAI